MCKCVFCISVLKAENDKDFNKKKFVIMTNFQGKRWAQCTFLLYYSGMVVNILGVFSFFMTIIYRLNTFMSESPEEQPFFCLGVLVQLWTFWW